jgi:PEP-CTERM motif
VIAATPDIRVAQRRTRAALSKNLTVASDADLGSGVGKKARPPVSYALANVLGHSSRSHSTHRIHHKTTAFAVETGILSKTFTHPQGAASLQKLQALDPSDLHASSGLGAIPALYERSDVQFFLRKVFIMSTKLKVRDAFLKSLTAGLIAAAFAAPASANLILNTTITEQGTGLGAVPTVVTVMDAGATGNGIESGCVSASGAGTSFTCLNGLQGGDNQAINNLIPFSSLTGITNAGQLALIVNINEPGNDDTAVLTDLYLAFFNSAGTLIGNHQYVGPDLTLQQVSGIGGAGTVFTLDPAEALLAAGECTAAVGCRIGAGVQFAAGTTAGGLETVFVSFTTGDGVIPPSQIPEPASLALVGLGLLGLAGLRRKKT